MSKKHDAYLPNVRSSYKPKYSDSIVANNIACNEFNYTESLTENVNTDSLESEKNKKS